MPITDSKPTSDNPQTQAPQNVQHVAPYPQLIEDDTINLYEMWITLWNKKGLVIAVTVIAALGSVVFALLQPPIYKAEALLLPPGAKDMQSLNIPGILGVSEGLSKVEGMQGINPASVFAVFKKNLSSRTLQKKFILENGLMDLLAPKQTVETRDEDIYSGFAGMIKIGKANRLTGSISVSIELHDAEIASQWVNDFIKFIDIETIRLLGENIRNSIANRIRDIESTIDSKRQMVKRRREDQIEEIERSIKSKRKMAHRRREDKIVRYTEAAKTAKTLGIRSGLTQQTRLVDTSSGRGEVTPLTAKDNLQGSPYAQMNVDIATATTPLFFIGFDALEAVLNNLKSRTVDDPFIPGLRDLQEKVSVLRSIKSDDPFIPRLRDLQEQLALLRSLKIEEEKLHAVNIDQSAYPPKNRIKPDRRLIVLLGTVVGLFLGISLVFFVSFVQKQKGIHSE